MLEKCVISFIIIALLNFVGCYSSEIISKREIQEGSWQIDFTQGITIVTSDYNTFHFLPNQYHIENDTLYGSITVTKPRNEAISKDKIINIALADVISFEQSTVDAGKTIGLIAGIVVLGLLLFGIITAAAFADALNPD